jgi:hypothetical protein
VDVDAELTTLSPERRPVRRVPSSAQCFARSAASRWEAAPAARQAEIDGHGMTSRGRVIVAHVTALAVHCRRVVPVYASLRMWATPMERECVKYTWVGVEHVTSDERNESKRCGRQLTARDRQLLWLVGFAGDGLNSPVSYPSCPLHPAPSAC